MTIAVLLSAASLCWAFLVKSESVMSSMRGEGVLMDLARAMMQPSATGSYIAASALMWAVMMSAMMTPAVTPLVLLFSRLDRGGTQRLDGTLFACGYLLVWIAYGLVATLLQWSLHRAAFLHGHSLAATSPLAAVLLLAAGIYQFTPMKTACLSHCQSPLAFLMNHWRNGRMGALQMGMHHGTYCMGCCWALMLLMFVSGVMSTIAMVALTLFILAERLLPPRPWSAKVPGFVLVAWAAWMFVA